MKSKFLIKDIKLPNYLTIEQKEKIILAIKNNKPIIIKGNQGPTGKTTLKNLLSKYNIRVYEEFECEFIELNNKL